MPTAAATGMILRAQPLRIEAWQNSSALTDNGLQVWQASQSEMTPSLEQLRSLLQDHELQRANRYRFDKDRNQFIIARALLRTLLANCLSSEPNAIRFQFSDKGKPSLAGPEGSGLQFNVAHSGDLVLLAFSKGRRLGVDIEQVRRDFATDDVAERFFSVVERRTLRGLPPDERAAAFFRCWTRKEAYIKATGDGLSLPLDQFDVSLRGEEPARLAATRPDPAEAERWMMYHLDVDAGYAAALVIERMH